MDKSLNALRVAKYKTTNPDKAQLNKLKEHINKSQKRMNNSKYNEDSKQKERERKRKQRAEKKNKGQVGVSISVLGDVDNSSLVVSSSSTRSSASSSHGGSSPGESSLSSSTGESGSNPDGGSSGQSSLPVLGDVGDFSLAVSASSTRSAARSSLVVSASSTRSSARSSHGESSMCSSVGTSRPIDVEMSFSSDEENMEVDTSSLSINPLASSTPDRLIVKMPFRNKTNSQNISRQAKHGLIVRKKNNREKTSEMNSLKSCLEKAENENIEKDFQIAELNNKIRELMTENDTLKEKVKHSDDWLKHTYKYMTPTGRSELKTGAYLAKAEFPVGTLSRIRDNTGLNFSKSPIFSSNEGTALKKAVEAFAKENSCEVPDMKAARKGQRYFFCYKYVLWMQFESSLGLEISYSQFCRYWPPNIVKPRIEDIGSCKCIPCENSELLLSALKRQDFVSKEHELEIIIKDSRSGEEAFENKFKEDLKNLKDGDKKDKSVSYLSWQKVQTNGDNQKREKIQRVQKTSSCSQAVLLMEELFENLKSHLDRNFIMKKTIKQKRDEAVSSDDKAYVHIDWAENLELKIPGEVQSAFFSHTSISIHTGYLYSKEDCGGFASLSDNKNHKAEAVHAALKPLIQKLVDRGIKHIFIVSDSPTSQYRNNKNVFLTKELAVLHHITIEWFYTEAGHGKSCCDGIGGTVKNILRDVTAFNTSIVVSDAKDVMELIKPHTTIDLFWYEAKNIEEIKNSLPSLSSLKGALKIHQIVFDSCGNVKAKELPTDPIFNEVKLKILRNNNNRRFANEEDDD